MDNSFLWFFKCLKNRFKENLEKYLRLLIKFTFMLFSLHALSIWFSLKKILLFFFFYQNLVFHSFWIYYWKELRLQNLLCFNQNQEGQVEFFSLLFHFIYRSIFIYLLLLFTYRIKGMKSLRFLWNNVVSTL